MTRTRVLAAFLATTALLAGCSGGSDDADAPAPEPSSTTPTQPPPLPTAPPTTPGPGPEPEPALTVASFNALGSQHTEPGGSRAQWPSGVERVRGLVARVRRYDPDIVGLQELQRAQQRAVRSRMKEDYALYSDLDNSVLWRRSTLRVIDKTSLTIPYFGGRPREMPVVRLRWRGTGEVVTVVSLHNPASVHGDATEFRAEAVRIERDFAEKEAKAGRRVLVVGDFNERGEAFCPMTATGVVVSAEGGSHDAGDCRPPSDVAIDQVFGAGLRFGRFLVDKTTRTDEVSDHPFVVTRARLGDD